VKARRDSPTKTSTNLKLAGRCPSPQTELSDSRRDVEPMATEPSVAILIEDECDDPVDSEVNVGDPNLPEFPPICVPGFHVHCLPAIRHGSI
jgi:hypothetical protein